MHRTNINLGEDQVVGLKYIAADQKRSVSELIRESIDEFLAKRTSAKSGIKERMNSLLARVRARTAKFSPDEIEKDITAASLEVRALRRKKRKRVHT